MKTQNSPMRVLLIIAAFIVAGLCFNNVFGQGEDTSDCDMLLCESVIDISITNDLENESVVVVFNGELLALSTPHQHYMINCVIVSDGEINRSNIKVQSTDTPDSDIDEEVELEDWMFEVIDDEPEIIEQEEEIAVEDWMMDLSTWTTDG
jgi:hypothetical protein